MAKTHHVHIFPIHSQIAEKRGDEQDCALLQTVDIPNNRYSEIQGNRQETGKV